MLMDITLIILGYAVVLLILGGVAVLYLLGSIYKRENYQVISIKEYKELELKNRALKKAHHILEREQTKLEREFKDMQRDLEVLR